MSLNQSFISDFSEYSHSSQKISQNICIHMDIDKM